MNNNKANDEWKHDADYIRYVESGESAAVFVVRDVVRAVNTKGKWIDILSLSTHIQDEDGRAFDWIAAEIFPRKMNPEYDSGNEARNKYLTWKTAHYDISQQRSEGYSGPKFLVLCDLIDRNEGKFITFRLTSITKRYEGSDGEIKDVEQKITRPEIIREPMPHDWEYRIRFLKRITQKQAEYIKSHEAELIRKIEQNRRAVPDIFRNILTEDL